MNRKKLYDKLLEKFEWVDSKMIKAFVDELEDDDLDRNLGEIEREFNQLVDDSNDSPYLDEDYDYDEGNEDHF